MYEDLAKAIKDATKVRMSSFRNEDTREVVLRVTRNGEVYWMRALTEAYIAELPQAGIEHIQGEHFAAAEALVEDVLSRVDWSKFYG